MTTPGSRNTIGVRVRPNADNFIRELRAQLATRRFTFYVDVNARTSPATQDVRQWARTTLQNIHAAVPVSATLTRANAEMADWRRKQSQNAVVIPVRVDTSKAWAEIQTLRAIAERGISIPVRADERGLRFDAPSRRRRAPAGRGEASASVDPVFDKAAFNRNIQNFLNDQRSQVMRITPELDIDPNIKRGFQKRVNDMLKDTKAKVDVDTEPADRSMRSLLQKFGGELAETKKFSLDLELDPKFDYKLRQRLQKLKKDAEADAIELKFEAEMAEVNHELNKLELGARARKLNIPVDLDVDERGLRLQMAKLRLEEKRRKLVLEVATQGRGMENMMNAFKRMENSVGSIATLRSIDLGPFSIGKPTGLMETLTTLTALAGLVPAIVTGIAALSNAFMSLAGAAAIVPGAIGAIGASLTTLMIGTSGVGDAFGAMFDMWTEGASEQANQANNLVSAHNAYRNAVVDEAKAQEDVGKARRDALGDLRALNNELRGSVLNEAQAILDAQKARDRYAQGLAEGFDTETDRLQGLVDIAKADQNIIDVRERNIDLQQRVNEGNVKGVEGSDRVTQALEAQTRAAQATAQAAFALTQAQQGAGGAASKFEEAIQHMSPNAQEFMRTIAGMKGEILGFRNQLQDTIFQGLTPAFTNMFNNLMPVIGPGMNEIAKALNQNILAVFDSLQTPEGQSIIERILGGTAEMQREISGLIDPMVRGFGTLMAAGAEHMPQFVNLMTELADRFANFIEKADESGALDAFMDRGIKALGDLANIGTNLLGIIGEFDEAFQEAFGDDVIGMISDLTAEWLGFLRTDEGKADLLSFIQQARDLWEDWKPILDDLPEIFRKASDAANFMLNQIILPALNLFTEAMEHAPGLVQTFVAVWASSKVVGVFSGLASNLALIIKGMKEIPALFARITGLPIPDWMKPDRLKTPPIPGGGGPGVLPAVARPSVLGPIGTVGIPTVVGDEIVDRVTGQDLPVVQRLGIGFKQPARWFHDIFTGGSDVTRIDRANEAIKGKYVEGREIPKYEPEGHDAAQALIGSLVEKNSKAGQWVAEAPNNVEQSRRYSWLFSQERPERIINDPNFVPPSDYPSYQSGGFTNWGKEQGFPAILHGKEYVQPADVTAFYGVNAMEAIHEKRIPREALQSFQGGGYVDPVTGQWVEGEPHLRATEPGPGGGGIPDIATQVTSGLPNVVSQFLPAQHGAGPAPGPLPPGQGAGPLPGPAQPGQVQYDASGNPTYGIDPGGGQYTAPQEDRSIDFLGFKIPVGPQQQQQQFDYGDPKNWPFGVPGIGKPGTTKEDAGKWLADWGAKTILGMGENILGGVLGFFGAEGLLNSPYMEAVRTTIGYYSNLNNDLKQKIQAPGADATNAAVSQGLGIYSNIPGNPAYPGAPGQMPMVFDPATGSYLPAQAAIPGGTPLPVGGAEGSESGLQANTVAMRRSVSAAFPMIGRIGGVREDSLKWHPSGRALDVMLPDGLENTPQGVALGNQIVQFALTSGKEFGAEHVIFNRKIYYADGRVEDYNGDSPHTDHAHIAMATGPKPTENMTFPTPSTGITPFTFDQSGNVVPMATPGTVPGSPAGTPFPWTSSGDGMSDLQSALNYTPYTGPLAPTHDVKVVPGLGSRAGGGSRTPGVPSGPGSYVPGTNPLDVMAGPGGGPKKQQLKALAKQLYMQFGMPPSEWDEFDWLVTKESSWDPRAKNPNSTAYGLGQFLSTTWDDVGGSKTDDPVKQLMYMFRYLKQRYHGSPAEAKAFHLKNNWYYRGGLVPSFYSGGLATAKPIDPYVPPFMPGQPFTTFPGRDWGAGDPDREPVVPGAPGPGGITNPGFMTPGLPGTGGPQNRMPGAITGNIGSAVPGPARPPIFTAPGFRMGGLTSKVMDRGGVIGPGTTVVHNFTGQPELVVPSYLYGGLGMPPQGIIPPKPQPNPSRGAVAQPKIVPAKPKITQPPPPPPPEPKPAVPAQPVPPPIVPAEPPPAPHGGTGAAPGPAAGESRGVAYGSLVPMGPGPDEDYMNLHPAAVKGIQSAAAVAGNLASSAISAGSFGMGGGGVGQFVGGLIQQGGKIITNLANVGASFLVGNLTGGTTENAYGVTQRGNKPSGGTRVVDASNNQYGNIYTNNLDEYFRLQRRKDDQRAQATLGHWGR